MNLTNIIQTVSFFHSRLWSVSFSIKDPSRGIYFLNNYRLKFDLLFLSLEALQAKIGTLSLEAQTKLEKEALKKEAKADAKADAALKKKLSSQVRICPTPIFC